jgi:hypothetical protein
MYALLPGLIGLTFAIAVAAAEKETTLTGDFTCGGCVLKQDKKCQAAMQVKAGDKTVTYVVSGDVCNRVVNDLWQKEKVNICAQRVKASATGLVKNVDGKLVLVASTINTKLPKN